MSKSVVDFMKDADAAILITEKDGDVNLLFNRDLSEMEVLDLLALVTSKFYLIAEEGDNTKEAL